MFPRCLRTQKEWAALRDGWMKSLREDCFRAWPDRRPDFQAGAQAGGLQIRPTIAAGGLRLTVADFSSEEAIPLTLWIRQRDGIKPEDLDLVVLNVLDDAAWKEFSALAATAFPAQFPDAKPSPDAYKEEREMLLKSKWAMAYVAPRGAGPQSWEKPWAVAQSVADKLNWGEKRVQIRKPLDASGTMR
jgi:hypothetical protein